MVVAELVDPLCGVGHLRPGRGLAPEQDPSLELGHVSGLRSRGAGPSSLGRSCPTDQAGKHLRLGVVELAVDRPKDEPRRLGALATELHPLVLFERTHEVAEEQVE